MSNGETLAEDERPVNMADRRRYPAHEFMERFNRQPI
jgi:hypothetical protein